MSHSVCPICERKVEAGEARPFCSPRCKQIDLGRWLGGDYRIAGERVDASSMAEEPGEEES